MFDPTEEHRILRQTAKAFAKNELDPQALEFDRKEAFNLPVFKKLGELGFLGLTAQTEFGGSGFDATASVIVHEELAASDPGFALAYLAHSLLCVNNIARNGSEDQKKRYLPKLCTGEWIGAMGMSEPHVGTDVLGMKTRAEKKGDRFEVTGRKMWITNGSIDEAGTPCDELWLYAMTGAKDAKPEISTFIVDRSIKGFKVGQKIRDKLGMRASNTAELVLDHCDLGPEQLVGTVGKSIKHMMKNLEIERLGLAAMGLGIAKRSLEIMVRYSKERTAFGQPLHGFGQIQRHLADSYAEFQACRAYVYQVASKIELDKEGNRLDSDAVKLVTTTMAKRVADRAIQVLGGYGYVGEYVVERLWRDAKLLEIGGGTLEAHQKNIANDLAKTEFSV